MFTAICANDPMTIPKKPPTSPHPKAIKNTTEKNFDIPLDTLLKFDSKNLCQPFSRLLSILWKIARYKETHNKMKGQLESILKKDFRIGVRKKNNGSNKIPGKKNHLLKFIRNAKLFS